MKKTVSLHTLGCKLNYSETSTIAGQFGTRGFEIVDHGTPSDVFVLNTCSVTENADRECRQIIRGVIRRNPDAYVIVTGCYAQLQPGEIAGIEGVDLVLGADEKFRLFDYIESLEKKEVSCVFRNPPENIQGIGEAFSADSDSRTRAFLKIQDGCDYKCSFCTIPLARGRSRSLPIKNVISNAQKLIDAGYKEIVLTGVNTGDYSSEGNNLADVLSEISLLDISRIRVSSVEPNLLTDEILELVASNPKFCRHFHIPLQSGDDEVLGMMRRRYKSGFYSDLIRKINETVPDAGIGVDVITGFPGEDEEKFLNSYRFIESLDISYLHVFTYSERRNTDAAMMPGKVDINKRRKRNEMLRGLSQMKKSGFYARHSGTAAEVLFESLKDDGSAEGYTSNYIRVMLRDAGEYENRIAKVRLGEADSGGVMDCSVISSAKYEEASNSYIKA
ncbi:MAG: tRNA (N(6)-L-threonylcarbamoyladenosine(37)-C(2))-methylthiotransferase MtaB [Ignavibacteria bacterium]|nr:tRNA (N(6)-L-threonylcarbamoyladenosine(37)-C(2))-methylthiotransferase MtaB [Ignavibacteria bacterium]